MGKIRNAAVLLTTAALLLLGACVSEEQESSGKAGTDFNELKWEKDMVLSYARQFSIESCEGYRMVSIAGAGRFLLVPEEKETPSQTPRNISVLKMPLNKTYLVSTSAMDLICMADALDYIRFSGTRQENWHVIKAKEAMEEGAVLYAGKYSAPDYELLLSEGCTLAIENTMIFHNPEVKEKLEELGIPVLVERSSYEPDPLGRLEWIKLYGVLFGKERQAETFFHEELKQVQPILESENTGLKAAFFSVSSNGSVTVRRSEDYIAKMIEMAGGKYVFSYIGKEDRNALSAVRMQMEDFYAGAKDADILIYNSAIEEEIESIGNLLDKNPLFADFKAIKEGNVYCTGKNFFQETAGSCDFIRDMNIVFSHVSGKKDVDMEQLRFLRKLR